MDGIINVYKESGWTSFDVVAKLRGVLKQKKIGHTGTLDPAATGVLPVCVGKATKLCELLTGDKKSYEAVLLLGVCTDTLDRQGQVLKTCPVECSEREVRSAIESFVGEQEQLPPMYSAIKVGGRRLYDLARAGVEVERKPRRVNFYEINITDIDLPRVRFNVTCSKGTYIRSLCADIGDALGCGGCMESLVRTASGGFAIEGARKISEIEALADAGRINEALISLEEALGGYPAVRTLPQYDKAVRNGGRVGPQALAQAEAGSTLYRMYDSTGKLIGIYRRSQDGWFKPDRMLL